jgi:hypothetical protein
MVARNVYIQRPKIVEDISLDKIKKVNNSINNSYEVSVNSHVGA